jgi:quercetin 2,3-dioxygenase
MITLRKNQDRGLTKLKWLTSYHTFSFGEYYDSHHISFGDLRVINDDIVVPKKGFPSHGHTDMEIITIVLSGKLEHQDDMGNKFVLGYGDVQRMSAGRGVIHSEFNHSQTEPVHLLQIWVLPNKFNLTPSYEQKFFAEEEKKGQFCKVISSVKNTGGLPIHQDMELSLAILERGQEINYATDLNYRYWVHVATGSIELNGQAMQAGDGASIVDEKSLSLIGVDPSSEILLFKLRK